MKKFIFSGLTLLVINFVITSIAEESPSREINPYNVTIKMGTGDVELYCRIDDLIDSQIIWQKVDTGEILTLHDKVVSNSSRIKRPQIDRISSLLTIAEVEVEDGGWYGCRTSTSQTFHLMIYLKVWVSPKIVESSSDLVVKEGSNVTLFCKASGSPTPTIKWNRVDYSQYEFLHAGKNVSEVDGDELTFTNVSRNHMGSYRCMASNRPMFLTSKDIKLDVEYTPAIMWIDPRPITIPMGGAVDLKCFTEAWPKSENYWTLERDDKPPLVIDPIYETWLTYAKYQRYMVMKIRNAKEEDFGIYKCHANNSMGHAEDMVNVEKMEVGSSKKI